MRAGTQTEAAQAVAFKRIRQNEGTLRGDALIEDETERQRVYDLLYPTGGVAYYTRARLGTELADRLSEYLTQTESPADVLGAVFVQRVQQDLGPFRAVRNQQIAAQTRTDDHRDDRRDLVAEINEVCDYDYHLLSAYFRADLGRAATYWDAQYCLRAAPAPPRARCPTWPCRPTSTANSTS